MNIPEVTDGEVSFGTVKGLPAYESIPKEFKDGHTEWNDLFNKWFFVGLKRLVFKEKEGVDKIKAQRHVRAIMASFTPSHEHKEAGVAYLMSQYFESADWEKVT